MNAHSPFGSLFAQAAAPVTINLTINGGVFQFGDSYSAPEVGIDPDTIYVNEAGVASLGSSLALIEDTIEELTRSLRQPPPAWSQETKPEPELKVRPSVGRIVHYRPTDEQQISHGCKGCLYWAALVCGVFDTGVGGDIVSLLAFPPGRGPIVINECVLEGDVETKGTWFWPAKAPRS